MIAQVTINSESRPLSVEIGPKGFEVTLRKNIVQNGDGTWSFQTVEFKKAHADMDEIAANFSKYWDKQAEAQMTDREKIKKLQTENETYRQALLELGTLVGEMQSEGE